MKNLIILFVIFTTFCEAQIYNLNDKTISRFEVPSGSYFKDIDGDYDKYVGLWKGNWDGKTIYIELKKVKDKMDDIYIDRIYGERKVIAANGTVEIDRISNFNYQHPEIWGPGFLTGHNGGVYPSFQFYPDNMCNMHARLVITNITTTQMTLHLHGMMGYSRSNCVHDAYVQQHGKYPVNFPDDIVLTKQ